MRQTLIALLAVVATAAPAGAATRDVDAPAAARAGYAVAGAGDVNGDRLADILLGAPGLNACKGQVLLLSAP